MKKGKKTFKSIFILPLLLQILLLAFNFHSLLDFNNPNFTNNTLERVAICQMESSVINNYQKNTSITIRNKDLSVIPEISNIFCLGKIVDVVQDEKEIIFFVGTNSKVFKYISLFNLYLFFMFLIIFKDSNLKFGRILILILFFCTLFNLNWLQPQDLFNRIKIIFIFFVLVIGLLELLQFRILNLFTYKLLIFFCFIIIVIFHLEQISYSLRLNRDTYVWLNTAIRMDFLNLFEYKSTWEHKGSIIFWVYYFVFKYVRIYENFWLNLGLSFILFNLFCSYIVYKLLNLHFKKESFNPLISFLIFLNLTFSPSRTTYSKSEMSYGNAFFDTRIIGSLFLLLGVYFLVKKQYNSSSFFLIIAVLVLPSFFISSSILFIFILLYELKVNTERIKLIASSTLYVFIYFFYLIVTNQIKEFYVINVKFNLLLNNVGEYYPIEVIIFQNKILFLNFAFILFSFNKLYKSYGRYYLITLIWSLTSILHLFLTGPRLAHYETLIIIPFAFCGGFLFYEASNYVKRKNLETKKNYLQYLIFVIFLGVYSLHYAKDLDYKHLIRSDNILSSKLEVFKNYGTFDRESIKLAIILVNDSDWDYLFNYYSFVPSTRSWPTLWHKRDEGWYELYPFNSLFSEEYFKNIFFADLENENPIYAILDSEIKSTHFNYLYDYVLNNFYIESCEQSYCIYKLKSSN